MSNFADVILVVHVAFVLFVVLALPLIWIGAAAHWRWVRHFWFRTIHLAAMGYVAFESVFDIACPLTIWEDRLRGLQSGGPGFIQRYCSRLLYFDFPLWVFIVAYVAFALLVLVTYLLIPPRRRAAQR